MRFKIVDKVKYELLEKIVQRTDNYIEQIKNDIKKIDSLETKIIELEYIVKENNILFKEKEDQRRKNAGKVGGLQASLNKEKEKNKILLKNVEKVQEELELKELELKDSKNENELLKNKGKKKKDIEIYKNYFECRKELEKRAKGKS